MNSGSGFSYNDVALDLNTNKTVAVKQCYNRGNEIIEVNEVEILKYFKFFNWFAIFKKTILNTL